MKNTDGNSQNRGTKKYPNQIRLYIPKDDMITFEKARKIVYREGRSLSDLFRDFLRDYVQRHEPGNPQMPIDRFLKEPEKQPEANVNPEDLRLMHQVIDHLEKGYDLSPKAAGQHRLLASKYLGKAEAAQRLMELLDHL